MAKYSYEFKLKVVHEYINGEGGYKCLAKKQFRIYETAFLSNQVLMFWVFAFLVFTGGGVGVISSAAFLPFFFLIM